MASRRQKKFARLIKELVSGAIRERLSDPRILGFVSVTRVEVASDLRRAEVFLSVFGSDERGRRLTLKAIEHAGSRIQSLVAEEMDSKFCPVLQFKSDEAFKKSLETMRLIEEAASEYRDEDEATGQEQ